MNIFAVDESPIISAQMLCDRHVSKMILETAQMLTSVSVRYGYPGLYKVTHEYHPSTLWAGDSFENWEWLVAHGIALEQEKIYRTSKGHASAEVIRWYKDNGYGPPVGGKLTPFAMAMSDKYKTDDPSASYRAYYLGEKQRFKDGKRPTWKRRPHPDWWQFK